MKQVQAKRHHFPARVTPFTAQDIVFLSFAVAASQSLPAMHSRIYMVMKNHHSIGAT
jgi:hypothetical protein